MSYRIGQATILGALLLLSACSSLWGHSGERELQRLVETGRFSDAVPLASRLLADAERSGDLAEVVKASVRLSAARRLSGDPRSALPVAGRALAVGRQSFPESALLADALSEVATVQQNLSARRESGELYREALSLRERILGPEDPSVARELTRLARVEFDLSRYDEALDLVARALSIQDRVLGADHDDVAESLRMKGLILTDRGRFDEAEAVLQRALRIKERLFGIDSVNIGAALFALARMEATSNRTGAAARDFERARRLYTAAYGPDHPQVLHQTYGLAYVYQQLGRRTEARQIYQEVLQAQERTGGPDDAARANLLLNMANNEIWAGDLVTAERLLKRAIHALNEISSAPPALVAQCMTALGNVYADRGLADDAVVLDRRALALFEQTLGTSNPLYAGALASLGLALELQGEAKEAQSLYARAVAKFEAAQGDQRKYSAGVLVLMSASKRSQGRYKEARVDAERATALLREALGEDHPDLAGAMLTLAPIEAALGREDRAEKLLREALSIGPGQLDPGHQVQSAANRQLGILLWKRGAMDEAADHFDHAQGAVDRRLGNALAAVSERRQQELLGELAEQMNAVVSFHLSSGRRSATASLALRSVLGYKGRALEAAGKQWEQARRRASPEDQRLLDELRDVRSQIAQFAYASDSGTTGNESKREALERQRFSLEERLATRVPINTTSPDINAIRAEIPEDAALVEIARYKRIAPRLGPVEPSGRDHYVAFVLHREGEIGVEDLGPASRIDRAVRSLRKVTGHPDDPNFREHARALDRMVFQPIERWMKRAAPVLLSPDSSLSTVPFAALVDSKGRYRVERFRITYLNSAQDLIRMAAGERGTEPPIVIGAPDFTASAATSTAISPSPGVSSNNDHASRDSMGSVGEIQANVLRSRDLNVHSLPPLPAAAAELRWIATRFDVSPLIGAQATEASLKAVRSPSIVHIATHAFFLDDVPSSERSPGSPRTKSSRKIASYENPLLRSGLFLAGASVRGDDEGEDGVLTALEVSGLDLAGTELVTLSGCDTGLGKVSNGDGVYGLRRALSLAGARSQMMSLWQVHDVATQRLMESYYGRLLRGEGRSEALRQVQLKMIEDPVFSDPYFWAPFIVAGDWKPLARSSLPQR